MKATVETITPERAKEYLERNMINRHISINRVNAYKDSIIRGDWQLNGEAIKFNKKGELIDGQHRLTAIIKANKPIEAVVIRGIAEDVDIIDRGRSRSIRDTLMMQGYDKSLITHSTVGVVNLHNSYQNNITVSSDSYIKEFLDKYPENLIFAYKCVSIRNQKSNARIRTSPFQLALFYALECGVNKEEVFKFSDIASSGFYKNEYETSAVVLRNDIIDDRITCLNYSERLKTMFAVENALNDFICKKPRQRTYSTCKIGVWSNTEKCKKL